MLYDSKRWDAKPPVNTDGFKTARQLGLRKDDYKALVKTLGRFERSEIPPLLFDMMQIGKPECGTAGCICGWVRTKHPYAFPDWASRRVKILFNLPTNQHPGWRATPQQAAVAIRDYLMTANPKWGEVMGMRKSA